jgi:hypothetical protein
MSTMQRIVTIAMASALVSNAGPVLAAHFEVGDPGSPNGDFVITGMVGFMSQPSTLPTNTYYPDGITDVDEPSDAGFPVFVVGDNQGFSTWYTCNATMHGSVVNGIASITSVSLVGGTKVCTFIIGAVNTSLPWRFHALSQPGQYTAMLKGISFYSPALFNCNGTTSMVSIGGGYAEFSEIPGVGCNFASWGNAAVVSPALNVVYP